jgi:hypothetical protein
MESKDHRFTIDSVLRHIRTMFSALDRLERDGYAFGARRVDVVATAGRAAVGDRIAEELGPTATRKPLEHAYYSAGLRYTLWVTDPEGTPVPLIDGGAFDRLARLTSNRRAIYAATGAGAQLIPFQFRA